MQGFTSRSWSFAVAVLVTAAVACAPGEPGPPAVYERTVLGLRMTLAPGWREMGEEVRSSHMTLLSFQAHSLDGAERKFLEGLPESLVPQLEQWARSLYASVGPPERTMETVGGVESLELVYRVAARLGDREAKLSYWIARRGELLYVLRATMPGKAPASDEAELRQMLAAIEFFEPYAAEARVGAR